MNFLNKIPPYIYLFVSVTLITVAIAIVFLGKFILSIGVLIMGILSLVAWSFLGIFEDSKKNLN
tara:strand:- start:289 stop:480 length:192 start_codon:yes stop_codon:yes gene_type:complete